MQVLFFPHQLPEILGGAGPGPLFQRAFLFCVSPQAKILSSSTFSMNTAIFLNNYFIISNMPFKTYPLSSLHSLPPPPQKSHRSKQKLLGWGGAKNWEFHFEGHFGSIKKILVSISCNPRIPFLRVYAREIFTMWL